MDKISESRIRNLHPAIRTDVSNIFLEAYGKNIQLRLTQGFRSWEEQEKLYELGRTLPGEIVTNAEAGMSWHNYGLAFDFCLLQPMLTGMKRIIWDRNIDLNGDGKKDWMQVVEIAKRFGFSWGGDWESFKDYPHLQKTFGLTIKQALEKYIRHDFDKEGYIIL